MSKNSSEEKFKEVDLFLPIAEYLTEQGYKVDAEVKDCDITAVKEEELIVIELKKSLNMTLLIQAVKRQDFADTVYVAIPGFKNKTFPPNWKGACKVLKRLELGLILVNPDARKHKVEIVFHPQEHVKRRMKKKKMAVIKEAQGRLVNLNKGGSTKAKIMTAYRENCLQVAVYLSTMEHSSPANLKQLGTGEKTGAILGANFYGWFERVEKGIYRLTNKGRDELELYPDIKEFYLEKLEDILDKKNC